MREIPRIRSWSIAFCLLLAFLMLSPTASLNARADDIPHENYTLVRSNLDVVLSLLRSTIRYSEFALMAMYNESMGNVDQNLTVVRGLLTPADRLLGDIRNVAESYANLSMLLPPFADLSAQMDSFSTMEVSLLGARGTIVSISRLANLTGDDLLTAIDAINRVNSLMVTMNRTIDDMLVSATDITGLTVDSQQPFADNQLASLIEMLRDLLYTIQYEVDIIVREGIRWNASQPFSMLWLSAQDYYLGEQIIGGGYLYYNGVFTPNHEVVILMDGENLTSVLTSSNGRFSFSYPIPVNASWLGPHWLQATSTTPTGPINSSVVTIRILLIPTTITLSISDELLSYEDELTASVVLSEVHGLPIGGSACHLILDGDNWTFATDPNGEFGRTWTAPDLGFGIHNLQAFYEGELPYAPSASGQLSFIINIPTSLSIQLFNTRFPTGYNYFVVGNGTLLANGTSPLPYQEITISIDGTVVQNTTTSADGKFVISVPTEGMHLGGHTLTAEFLHRDMVWRYSSDQAGFTIYALKQTKYPFFPAVPGWGGGGMPEFYPYLFIGPYAYYFWLLILTLAAVSIRLMQTRKRRKQLAQREPSETLLPLDRMIQPIPVPSPASAEGFAREISEARGGPVNPNERIIWYYQRLLAFLTRRENLSLRKSMTHWEVARMLKLVGYPSSPVDRITLLFEQALYSGLALSDMETVQMSASLTNLITLRSSEASNAV